MTLLAHVFAMRRTPKALRELLGHILTAAERDRLVRRLEVAARLAGGQSYRMIQDALRVSPNLVRRVDRWLAAERPGYRRLVSLRHRSRPRRVPVLRRERDRGPASLDNFLKRFPIWRNL